MALLQSQNLQIAHEEEEEANFVPRHGDWGVKVLMYSAGNIPIGESESALSWS